MFLFDESLRAEVLGVVAWNARLVRAVSQGLSQRKELETWRDWGWWLFGHPPWHLPTVGTPPQQRFGGLASAVTSQAPRLLRGSGVPSWFEALPPAVLPVGPSAGAAGDDRSDDGGEDQHQGGDVGSALLALLLANASSLASLQCQTQTGGNSFMFFDKSLSSENENGDEDEGGGGGGSEGGGLLPDGPVGRHRQSNNHLLFGKATTQNKDNNARGRDGGWKGLAGNSGLGDGGEVRSIEASVEEWFRRAMMARQAAAEEEEEEEEIKNEGYLTSDDDDDDDSAIHDEEAITSSSSSHPSLYCVEELPFDWSSRKKSQTEDHDDHEPVPLSALSQVLAPHMPGLRKYSSSSSPFFSFQSTGGNENANSAADGGVIDEQGQHQHQQHHEQQQQQQQQPLVNLWAHSAGSVTHLHFDAEHNVLVQVMKYDKRRRRERKIHAFSNVCVCVFCS
jgi:hypothetical protein